MSNFIDKQLDTYYRKHQLAYREGLAAFEKTVIQMKGKKFEELPFAEQTTILEKMEAGEFSGDYWNDHSPANFFNMIRAAFTAGFLWKSCSRRKPRTISVIKCSDLIILMLSDKTGTMI